METQDDISCDPASEHHGAVPARRHTNDQKISLTRPSQFELKKKCVCSSTDDAPNNDISGYFLSRAKSAMSSSDNRHIWDPYETSQKRDFIYRPNSSTTVLRPTTTNAYRNSYALTGPVGSTGYTEEFCWTPVVKPESIHKGTVSGNRRNNPHPNQGLMQSSANGWSSSKSPPSEEEFWTALTAQNRSTYQTDFLGMPQGCYPFHAPISCKRQVPNYTLTEMRHNYRQPRLWSELRGNMSRYGCNALHGVAPRGIVPTVIQRHIHNQENRTQLTTYDRHFGGKTVGVSAVLCSLQPQELQEFCKHLPGKDKETVQTFLHRAPLADQLKRGLKPPIQPPITQARVDL